MCFILSFPLLICGLLVFVFGCFFVFACLTSLLWFVVICFALLFVFYFVVYVGSFVLFRCFVFVAWVCDCDAFCVLNLTICLGLFC